MGVNLVGKCDNSNCRIHNEVQYFQKGFGTFSVNKEVYCQKCIACSKDLSNKDVTNMLFSRCIFSIEGFTQGKKVEKSGSTGEGKYITYKEEEPQELNDWNYLEVTASKL